MKMNSKNIIRISIAVVVGLVILLGATAEFITDYWWFKELGYTSVFWTTYETKYLLWFAGFIAFLLAANLNVSIALKAAPAQDIVVDPRLEALVSIASKIIRGVAYTIAVVLSFIMASMLSSSWMKFLTFSNSEGFGLPDPIFGHDAGFYLFQLPFYQDLRSWAMAAVILIFVLVLVVYLVRQGVGFAFGRLSISQRARTHLAALVGVFSLVLATSIWLGRYDVLTSARSGSFHGAGWTDVHGAIPAAWIMAIATLALGILLMRAIATANRRGIIRAVVVYVAAGIVVGGVYPALLQQFVVNPTEQSKELPYITNNIAMTRYAFELERIAEKRVTPDNRLTMADLREDSATVRNIMLWDYRPLSSTLDQLQVIRLYYTFPDVDIDRYRLPDGTFRQVMLSVRELDQNKLPANARTWVNLNLVYTHGYGVTMSPVNRVNEEGLPEFFIQDIPPTSSVGLTIDRPEVYFGEKTDNHVIVKGAIEEFDYPLGDQNQMTTYKEDAGVPVGSFLRRLIFAMRFADINILISGYITGESRILYHRQIMDRIRTIAPFLTYDEDPYITVTDGRLRWICDAYTTSRVFPYSKPYDGVTYIRNSVKAVVDAYNGSTAFYLYNPQDDPIIRVYRNIFPNLFRDQKDLPESLRAHVRYPQDLFDLQASVYETYHMEDPQVFYNKEDLWNVANEKLQNEVQQMESYYAVMRLPGERDEEFIQMLPFTPNRRDNMIAWLSARSDGDGYGKMLVYKFPKQALTYGPMQVSARFDQDPYISQQLTLWNQQGTSVTRGHLLVIPIKNDMMYIQPIYLQATSGKIPELARVIVGFGNNIAMEQTLDAALARVFSEGTTPEIIRGKPSDAATTTADTAPRAFDARSISRQALERYDRAIKAQRDGDWARYGEEIRALRRDLERLIDSK
jgi:uncharacterized protein